MIVRDSGCVTSPVTQSARTQYHRATDLVLSHRNSITSGVLQ
jgi:hypothetical protein